MQYGSAGIMAVGALMTLPLLAQALSYKLNLEKELMPLKNSDKYFIAGICLLGLGTPLFGVSTLLKTAHDMFRGTYCNPDGSFKITSEELI